MNKIYLIILILSVISCSRSNNISENLIKADSLMVNSPDSSFLILKSIDTKSLRSKNEKAYYALLFTQSLHKNYYPLKNDSLISIAVEYYQNKNDKIKYTKSLLYNGIALEEMKADRSAMEMYKKAEASAEDCDDYLLLGLINSRMGGLYSKKLIENNEDIEKYKVALHFFKLANHQANINYTTSLIGKIYRATNHRDSAYCYINKAIEYSKKRNDSINLFHNYALLASTYRLDRDFLKAKEICLYIIRNHNNILISNEVYHCLSRLYSDLKQIDSAYYYSRLIKTGKKDSLSYYITLKEIAKNAGDYINAYKYNELAQKITDANILSARKMDLYDIEKKYDNQRLININQKLELKARTTFFIIVLIILSLVISIISAIYIIKKGKEEIEEKLLFIEQLKSESLTSVNSFLSKLSQRDIAEIQLKELLDRRLVIIRKLIDISYRYESSPKSFMAGFNTIMKINKLDEGALNDLPEIVNAKYNGAVDQIKKEYPNLASEDINLLSLICCGFSATEMAVFFNYTNQKSIYGRKRRLSSKMNLDISLDEYISKIIHNPCSLNN
ncbi:MAG: TPR-repeat-containing protein [Bacteroidetes bacterium]|nr:TPR-repeat-containing protein [Bacteroidota bacterium]